MQLFGHPLTLVILDIDGVILDLMAGFERHLEANGGAAAPAHRAHSSLPRGGPLRRASELCQSLRGDSCLVASAQSVRQSPIQRILPHDRAHAPLPTGRGEP